MQVFEKLVKAFRVSCPIVTLQTGDPAHAVRQIVESLADKATVIVWDCVRGAYAPEQANYRVAVDHAKKIGESLSPVEALINAGSLPEDAVLIMLNAHRFLAEVDVMQAVWNLRDTFKQPRRMLVLMGTSFKLPAELQHDVIELDEPLPTTDELRGVIRGMIEPEMAPDEQVDEAAVASVGLTAFAAEQLAALNLSKDGLSHRGVWADKCRKIDETPGLQVVSGGSFEDVAGVEQVKKFLKLILGSKKNRPNAIVFVDELEKALGGSGTDTSGVSQDQLGVLLRWMQDKRASGCIFVGPPGTSKSALAKTAGGEVGIPTIQLDLGGMKGSLVGESESRIREALKVVDAVSGGRTLWLATSNNLNTIPPELKRRFKYGTWFFDLPHDAERKAIWDLYTGKFGLDEPGKLVSLEWTGAEIESCCEIADRTGCTLAEAAEFIVPVATSAAAAIEGLRTSAAGRFLSASYAGPYSLGGEQVKPKAGKRQLSQF